MRGGFFALGLCCASLGLTQPLQQSGIAHVAFRVADLEKSRAFYNSLGFEQFYEAKQGDRTTQAFLKVNDRQFIELYPRADASEPLGLMHVCYESTNLEALHEELVKRGVPVSAVRKAGAGNMLMTMKDPEGQTIEWTQYMPGSRHWEDRGKHLGANRVGTSMTAATSAAQNADAMRNYYIEKLGFAAVDPKTPGRLRMPGDLPHEIDIVADAKSGIRFTASDLKRAGDVLAGLGLRPKVSPSMVTISDPDGVVISFVK